MKKVRFDNRQSIALQKALAGAALEQIEVLQIEGWLIDDHVCVQKPGAGAGWRVSLYPWGDLIGAEFYTKDDAIEYAKDVSKFGVDWDSIYRPENYAKSARYRPSPLAT
jgi:hypothetical protein